MRSREPERDPLDRFAPIEGLHLRTVYVEGMCQADRLVLESRGYSPIEILTLPRETPEDHKRYLLAKAQGVEERTIEASAEDRKALELEMRAHGLLSKHATSLNVNVTAGAKEIGALLGWGVSRHTLQDNSTAIAAKLPELVRRSDG